MSDFAKQMKRPMGVASEARVAAFGGLAAFGIDRAGGCLPPAPPEDIFETEKGTGA